MATEQQTEPGEAPGGSVIVAAIQALRPKQWTKNALLFAALLFSFEFNDTEQVLRTLWGFGCFCLISSTGYIFNDLRDREADARHPKKSKRPIASGRLPVGAAWVEMAVVFAVGAAAAFLLSWQFGLVAMLYFTSTMSYTLYFKHQVILDIMFIAAGFLWRAAAGAVAIDVDISPWLLLCTAFFALFLGFNKRRGELVLLGSDKAKSTRAILAEYSPTMIAELQAITTSGTIISYALYTVLGSPTPWMLVTLPFVMYVIFRYIYLVQMKSEGDAPDETLLKDRPMLVTALLFGVTTIAVLLLAPRPGGGPPL